MNQNKVLYLFILLFFSLPVKASRLGLYATLNGSLDFINLKKIDAPIQEGTGFGLEVLSGLRFASFFSLGPFAMFSSLADSDDEATSYLFSGYGGEAKIRIAPINFKGGYGLYKLDEKKYDLKNTYTGEGWHAGIGFEALLGPGLTISLDAKYRDIKLNKSFGKLNCISAILGVTSYF